MLLGVSFMCTVTVQGISMDNAGMNTGTKYSTKYDKALCAVREFQVLVEQFLYLIFFMSKS